MDPLSVCDQQGQRDRGDSGVWRSTQVPLIDPVAPCSGASRIGASIHNSLRPPRSSICVTQGNGTTTLLALNNDIGGMRCAIRNALRHSALHANATRQCASPRSSANQFRSVRIDARSPEVSQNQAFHPAFVILSACLISYRARYHSGSISGFSSP